MAKVKDKTLETAREKQKTKNKNSHIKANTHKAINWFLCKKKIAGQIGVAQCIQSILKGGKPFIRYSKIIYPESQPKKVS